MVGSHRSGFPEASRFWIACLGVLAIVATACGADEVATAPATEELAVSNADVDDAPAVQESADESLAAADSDAPVQSTGPTTEVLAFASDNSESVSYTFEQGMSVEIDLFGIEMNVTPTEAFITGAVDGDERYVRIDIGTFLESTVDTMSSLEEEPSIDDLTGVDLSSLIIESWNDGETQVLDMSQLVGSMETTDPTAVAELAPFADGPVMLDVGALAEAGGIDPSALLTQLDLNAQYTDPAGLFNALRSIDAVSETGADVVNGDPVTVYVADMLLGEYADALGVDVVDQIGALGDLGFDPNDPTMSDLVDGLDVVPVVITTRIDADGRVRRLDVLVDVAPIVDTLIGTFLGVGEDVDSEQIAAMFGEVDVTAKMETWQVFDNYGEPVDIVVPAAPDRTAELSELFELE